MRADKSEGRRLGLRQSDKIILAVIGVLVLVIVVLNILQRFGLSLVNGALMMHLPVLALCVLVIWGGYALIRRIQNRTAKIIVGGLAGAAMLALLMLAFTYVSFVSNLTIPRKYMTLVSPSGAHKLVVLRGLDPDEERIEQRKAARLAANPESDPDVTAADWGYIYKAYPEALMGLFYRSNADVEGEVYLTYRDGIIPTETTEKTEEAQPVGVMMMEWLDDGSTAHFYVENAGVAEGGECTVRF